MTYDGDDLPFDDCSFDVVVSLDTLEHVPPGSRVHFMAECERVARRTLLVAAPYGTPGHSAYEAKLDDLYRDVYGDHHRWLHEHVLNGLPCEADLVQYRQLLAASRLYDKDLLLWQLRMAVPQPRAFPQSPPHPRPPAQTERILRPRHACRSLARAGLLGNA